MTSMRLPKGFEFGVATSAYQIEGAWSEEGKGPSIWDTFTHGEGNVVDGRTGDVACDHFHRYPEDIELLTELGVDRYRLSLSWARILPNGVGAVNQRGLDFYKRLIDSLLAAGVRPNVTLYHWDLPQALEDHGGWPNRDVASWFGEYAAVAFDALGDRVDTWATLNEPIALWAGYGLGWFAPGRSDRRAGRQAMHNALLAHGEAVSAFRSSAACQGEIGIVLDVWKRHPKTDSLADRALARRGDQDGFGFFMDPLLRGAYSADLLERLEEEDELPDIRDGDVAAISCPIDYLGLNVYSRVVVDSQQDQAGWAQSDPEPGGNFLDNGNEFYPKSVYDAIMMARDEYGWQKPIVITENGVFDPDSEGHDPRRDRDRIRYIEGFLEWIARAIEDGADVRGYYLWSLMDNFEWNAGFTKRYGIYGVDPETLDRWPKDSAHWYRDVIAAHHARHGDRAGREIEEVRA